MEKIIDTIIGLFLLTSVFLLCVSIEAIAELILA